MTNGEDFKSTQNLKHVEKTKEGDTYHNLDKNINNVCTIIKEETYNEKSL